jgi:hypothetical protein
LKLLPPAQIWPKNKKNAGRSSLPVQAFFLAGTQEPLESKRQRGAEINNYSRKEAPLIITTRHWP